MRELLLLKDMLEKYGIGSNIDPKENALIIHDTEGVIPTIKQIEEELNTKYNVTRKQCNLTCPICKGEVPIVRVAGFSAYFTDMHKEVQDQIIARTKQRL